VAAPKLIVAGPVGAVIGGVITGIGRSVDALDATIAAFAAIAVATDTVAGFRSPDADGFISVAE